MPYLYSRVRCCAHATPGSAAAMLGPKYDVPLDELAMLPESVYGATANRSSSHGGVGALGACEVPALPRTAPQWSHSSLCNNFGYVRNAAQETRGIYTPLTTLLRIVIIPSAGFLADVHGRKLVLTLSALGPAAAALLWCLDAWLQPHSTGLVYAAGASLSLSAMGGPAHTAMLADLVTPAERGSCFPVLYAVQK
jgi:MFS family permease